MTKSFLPLLGVFVLTIASESFAESRSRPTLSITGVHAPASYTGGAYNLQIDLASEASAAGDVLIELTNGSAVVATTTIAMPASAAAITRTVSLTDAAGLPACSGKSYVVNVTPPNSPKQSRGIAVTPSCTFAGSIVDGWSSMVPDRIDMSKKGTVYLVRPVLEDAPTCQSGPKVKVDIVNDSKLSSASLIVQVKSGTTVTAQTAAAFPLPAGGSKEVVATPIAGAHDGTADGEVVINDWTHGLGSSVLQSHSIVVKTTRKCTLNAVFADIRTLAKEH